MLTYGRDASDNVIPLLLDANGNIIVSAGQLTTTGGKLHVDANGDIIPDMDSITSTGGKIKLDASNQTVIVGDTPYFTKPSQRNSFYQNTNLPAGSANQTVVTVPAGETWRVSTVALDYVGTTAGVTLTAFGYDAVNIWVVGVNNAPISGQWVTYNFNMILEAGEQFLVAIGGATAGDDFLASLIGERIY
jgi:hypothetical protein